MTTSTFRWVFLEIITILHFVFTLLLLLLLLMSLQLCHLNSLIHSKTDEYGFKRPDDFDYLEYEKFMTAYLNYLTRRNMEWISLMIYNPQLKRNSKLKKFVRTGIPLILRGPVSCTSIYLILFRIVIKFASSLPVFRGGFLSVVCRSWKTSMGLIRIDKC